MSFLFRVCSVHRSRCAFRTALLLSLIAVVTSVAQTPHPKEGQTAQFQVVAFYSPNAEPDHVQFAEGALKFFSDLAVKDKFVFNSTTDWANLNPEYLKKYQVVIWLTD